MLAARPAFLPPPQRRGYSAGKKMNKNYYIRKMTGKRENHARVKLLGVSIDDVLGALNALKEKGWNTENAADRKEYAENGVNVVDFSIYGEDPVIVFPITDKLNCMGYADAEGYIYPLCCGYKGVESHGFSAKFEKYIERSDGHYDISVRITDPTGIVFQINKESVDAETAEYYRDLVAVHP